MKGYIYLIENKINNKKYIGKTYDSIENRWSEHKRERNAYKNRNRPLYLALNKYGVENFSISEIEYCDNCEEREQFWINYYDTYKNGYNATLGGDGRSDFPHSDEEIISKYSETKSVRQTARFFNCAVATVSSRLKNNEIELVTGWEAYNQKRNWLLGDVEQYSKEKEYIQSFTATEDAAIWMRDNNFTRTINLRSIQSCIGKAIKNDIKYCNFYWQRKSRVENG